MDKKGSRCLAFDPKALYDLTNHRAVLLKVDAATYPNGITITGWDVSFDADPTTEMGSSDDLMYADALIGVGNATKIADLDTTNGAASATSLSVSVAAGKVIYVQKGTSTTDTGESAFVQISFNIN
jgi:hypothetical protein